MTACTIGRPPPRPITRLLVANRGEIATRILSTAREFDPPLTTYALATSTDNSHTLHAAYVLQASSPSTFLSIDELLSLVRQHSIDAIHPGYGFLSESADFAKRAWDEAGAVVIGPGWAVLERTSNKLQARTLARECGVPVLEATERPVADVEEVRKFAELEGLPVMVKAVDGGGGRGIRLVTEEKNLENLVKRAIEESPSKQVFVEKAAIDGFRHIEVQVVGDGKDVSHLWERECSIQRRYQKIVEIAPSTITDRKLVTEIINAALRMARSINFFSLGTFEFLCNDFTSEFYFMEVNARLQVEHTISESVSLVDIVKIQLQLAQGTPLASTGLGRLCQDYASPPPLHSIQLRITAENVQSNWTLSVGKIHSFHFPSGNGIRIDTHLVHGYPTTISADYDSLLAKIIVTAASWEDVVLKARRALTDTHIEGVKTNLDVLRGITASQTFKEGACSTKWLEINLPELLDSGQQISSMADTRFFKSNSSSSSGAMAGFSNSTVLLRKGDAWSIKLFPLLASTASQAMPTQHLKLQKIMRNDFPTHLSAEVAYSLPSFERPQHYRLELSATTASSSALLSEGNHRRGDPANQLHVIIPFPGKLVEVLVNEGDVVQAGDVICVVRQMKMELEVRASRGGAIKWLLEADDGDDVAEGTLAAELKPVQATRARL